jgi:hypothetical protein
VAYDALHISFNSLKLPAHLYIKSTMHPHDLDPNGHVLVLGCTITRVEEVGVGHNADLEVIYMRKMRHLKCEDPLGP